jgi:hypothetical protein
MLSSEQIVGGKNKNWKVMHSPSLEKIYTLSAGSHDVLNEYNQ